ncbi:hypothetical protein [Algibacter sp. 2305UL17-15]|uniref:hypothetical protein n=1 Tax=Algibacter sp. 2305UL17-15 TaxID=3231268 RepID=UPI0034581487
MDDQNYILFEAYLSDELSKDEIIAFETRLKTESEFHQAFETYKELSSFLEHKFENEAASHAFQKNLNKISEAHFNKVEETVGSKGTTKTYTLMKYLVAACVVVLFGIFSLNQFSSPTYGDYADYNQISLTVRGANSKLLQTAENAFNTKDFAKAEEAFSRLIAEDETNSELKLYSAISNIELNNFETADGLLEDLRRGNSAFKHKATWYLALSKLKQDNETACFEILKTIPEDAEDYEKAQKLIKKLD